jgi:MOSC domain-containing protein YiiM
MDWSPYLYQINCSQGGLPKLPLTEAWVSVEGLGGDGHRNKILHGGPDRAICVFSFEVIEALQQEGHTIYPGASGENFTLAGLDWAHIQPGDHMKIGEEVRIEFTSFCEPCRRIAQWFHEGDYDRIAQQQHPGWSRLYARVLAEGQVRQGDRIWVENLSKGTLT